MINNILLKIKYPKLLLLFLVYIITISLFYSKRIYLPFHDFLASFGYLEIFLGGIFYAYSFTAAPATVMLLALAKQYSLIPAAIVAGVGALSSDIIIFLFVRYSINDEVEKLKKEKITILIRGMIKKLFGSFINYLQPIIASFLIASPLPTEIGVVLLSTMKELSVKNFLLIVYLLHTLGIYIVLLIGNAIQ